MSTFEGLASGDAADEPMQALSGFDPGTEARTPFDWLSRDPDEVDRYIADPLCGDDMPLTYGFVRDLFGVVVPAVERDALSVLRCPVLLVTGDHDAAAGMGANASQLEAALRAAGVAVTSTIYPGARHELLNETNRDEVTADIVSWLDSNVGS